MFITSDIKDFSVEDCTNYMEKKYGGKFELSRPYTPDQPGKGSLKIYVKTDKYPDKEIFVIQEDIGDSLAIHDNLADIMFEDETRSFLTRTAESVLGSCRLIYEVNKKFYLPDDFNEGTSFEEYIATGRYHIRASIVLPPDHGISQKEEDVKKLIEAFGIKKASAVFDVYYTKDNEIYQSVNSYAELENNRANFAALGWFEINDDFTAGSITWR